MAAVYSPPADFVAPDLLSYYRAGSYDFDGYQKAQDEYIKKLCAEAKRQNTGDLVGELVRFPIADGFAVYVVWCQKPLQLMHVPVGDGWQIPAAHARGLRLQDIRQMVERDRKLAKLFALRSSG